jgi:O-antigen ligase
MARANPVIGVGADNYTVRAVDYLLEPGAVKRTDFIVDTPKVAHNTPLHVLAELGVIGFGLLLTVLLFSVACGVRAWRAFESRGDPEMATFARAVTAAQISMLVAACFISAQYNKPMWLMLSLTPALLALARAGRPEASR